MASIASSARSVARAAALRGAARNLAADAKAARRPPPRSLLQGQRPPAAPRLLRRSPVELSCCAETLLPMHSATASALMTSMLSVSLRSYARLSEAGNDDV